MGTLHAKRALLTGGGRSLIKVGRAGSPSTVRSTPHNIIDHCVPAGARRFNVNSANRALPLNERSVLGSGTPKGAHKSRDSVLPCRHSLNR